jgi:hypothetical protein
MNCEYCKSEFKTKYALNNHKIKAKYCLIIQGKIKKEKEIFKCNLCDKVLSTKQKLKLHQEKCKDKKDLFKCDFCNKILSSKQYLESHMKKCEIIEEKEIFQCVYCNKILSSKQKLEYHTNICDKKKENMDRTEKEKIGQEIKILKEQVENKEKELKEKDKLNIKLKIQNENYEKQIKIQNENYEKQIKKQEDQIKDLQDKLENLASKAIDKPTSIVSNTTTNNSLNIATSMNFNDIEQIKDIIENYLTINHVVDGQKGLANFVKETMLVDDNGKLKYICTDSSRNIFKYKDTDGEIKKDVEAKKLTDCILKGGIRARSAIIGNEWLQNEENNKKYIDKLEIMMEFQENIHKLGDNNTNFKKELATLTS